MSRIDLGDEVKDNVTGFKGIAIGRTIWLQGCDRVGVQPKIGKSNEFKKTEWFDEPQLTVIKRKKYIPKKTNTGGPMQSDPSRPITG